MANDLAMYELLHKIYRFLIGTYLEIVVIFNLYILETITIYLKQLLSEDVFKLLSYL